MKHILFACLTPIALVFALVPLAHAEDNTYSLKIKEHRFEPEKIEIPADKKVKLLILNADNTAEEFDSDDLHREKFILPGKESVVFIGPLKPGSYRFIGEYNQATAHGLIIVK